MLGTLAFASTSWAAFDPNLNEGVPRHFEPGRNSAQCGFVRASHCEFGAFFPRRWWAPICIRVWKLFVCASPDYEYLDRFVLGLGRKMMKGKATISTKLEDGTEKKRTVDRRKVWDFLGLVPSVNGTSSSSPSMVPEPYERPYDPPERLVFLFWLKLLLSRIPFLVRTAGYANQHCMRRSSAMAGRRGWSRSV